MFSFFFLFALERSTAITKAEPDPMTSPGVFFSRMEVVKTDVKHNINLACCVSTLWGHESELGESLESCHTEDVGHLGFNRNRIQHGLADGGGAQELSVAGVIELNSKNCSVLSNCKGRTTGRFY